MSERPMSMHPVRNLPMPDRAAECDYLRAVVESAAAGILVQDEAGLVIDCNEEAERLFELARNRLIGRCAIDPRWRLLREDGSPLPTHEQPAVEAQATGRPVNHRIVGVVLDDGRQRWLQASARRIQGRVAGTWVIVSSFTDLTAQRQAMSELAAERQRLRATLDGTQAGAWEWNLQTGEARANERWASIGGWTIAELEPMSFRTWTDMAHPDDLPVLNERLRQHACGQAPFFEIECRMRHKRGDWLWVAVRGRISSWTEGGKPLWMYGTHVDITPAKEAEQALRRANTKLQALFDLSPVGIGLHDMADGRFLECNDAQAGLLGYGREQLGSMRLDQILPPERLPQLNGLLAGLPSHGRFGPLETEVLHQGGGTVPVLLSGMRVSLPDGSERLWAILQDITPRKRMEQRLRNEARTDSLTGLPNRAQLMEGLARCVRTLQQDATQGFTLLFLDFDRFKLVNDTLGHDAGDQLLQHIADRLRQALRTSDVRGEDTRGNLVARFGGDEFVVLLTDTRGADAAARVATRLLNIFAAPYIVRHKEIHSSASIGIVLADAGCDDASVLLRNADMAMYEAKRAGRSTFAFFDESMVTRLSRAVRIENALHQAVRLDQLSVVYQPVVSLDTGCMVSAEALMRWQHPELGAVSPAEFIPIAEESGLIVRLGDWVLREACKQWRRWQDEDPVRAPAMISVNLSRMQMAHGEQLLDVVADALAQAGMAPEQLQLEVTEREVMRDPSASRRVMDALRAMGVRLAMDDFGTGASSLGCLREYPFDTIKIDKSFIDELRDRDGMLAVLHATVSVIENLGMVSVAEGVEDELQLGVLQSLGCRLGQGYYFSRPVVGERLLDALAVREGAL
jgi:diguanylate cyclase (GGDEF)-like protein/PAS domain S-box-containing protein